MTGILDLEKIHFGKKSNVIEVYNCIFFPTMSIVCTFIVEATLYPLIYDILHVLMQQNFIISKFVYSTSYASFKGLPGAKKMYGAQN